MILATGENGYVKTPFRSEDKRDGNRQRKHSTSLAHRFGHINFKRPQSLPVVSHTKINISKTRLHELECQHEPMHSHCPKQKFRKVRFPNHCSPTSTYSLDFSSQEKLSEEFQPLGLTTAMDTDSSLLAFCQLQCLLGFISGSI